MTVIVYIWRAQGGQVGHASMELEDGTYISLWPGEDKAGKKKKRKVGKKQDILTSENLQEDIKQEGRSPDHVFHISGLDESKIRTWWIGFNKTSWSWTQNCCQTVVDGLREGGSDSKLSWANWTFYKVTAVWTPRRLVGYCKEIASRSIRNEISSNTIMTVAVYIWQIEGNHWRFGHASMKLGDGTYISLKCKALDIHTSENLQEDIDEEVRSPDHVFHISGLDESKIRTWWIGFDETSWSWMQNCCQTVVDGLREGGSDNKLSWANWMFYKVTAVWTPRRLTGYCEALTG